MMGLRFWVVLILILASFGVIDSESFYVSRNTSVVSPGRVFELGFFSFGGDRWYFGIWYKEIPTRTYVWVGNRDAPVYNSNATLQISGANLVLRDYNRIIWDTQRNKETASPELKAELLDNGNFVLRYSQNKDPGDYLWQSFDYPTDTLLPHMKLISSNVPNYASDLKVDTHLSSWKAQGDPSIGAYKCGLQTQGFTVLSTWTVSEPKKMYRSGAWNGIEFGDLPLVFNSSSTNQDGAKTSFMFQETKPYSRVILNSLGLLTWYTWDSKSQEWISLWDALSTRCDQYDYCGTNSYCDGKTSKCNCIEGFEPKNNTSGCVRKTPLRCDSDTFSHMTKMKIPDSADAKQYSSRGMKTCRDICINDCHCTAYTMIVYQNGTLSSNCVTWSEPLMDVQAYAEGGQDLYIRGNGKKKNKRGLIIGLSVGATAAVIIIVILVLVCLWKRKQQLARATAINENVVELQIEENIFGAEDTETPQLPPMDFGTILSATENFSDANEIGHGGFGTVYKGRLPDGQEIAVKKLSGISKQGTVEFKTEVMLIANLQHINLVRLLGWSVHEDERVLVYEYLENGSLHHQLFGGGGQNSCELNWPRRFDIIKGIAQGLAYMQEGSRDMIIHRDLKPANILLDRGMIPKISDFGLARICNRSERKANTTRPSGSIGYMSPEYAESGAYSTKSDIFSFGVMLLEIVSGKENRTFSYTQCNTNLLSYLWTKWNDDNWEDTVDHTIRDSSSFQNQQVRRCLEVGLLSVQQDAEDRPNMSSVLFMLVNDTTEIPSPKLPGFFKADGPNEIFITSGSLSTAIYSSSTSRPSY